MVIHLEELVSLVEKENMKVLQIGVWEGESVMQYLDIIRKNNGLLYVIDYFEGNPNASGEHSFNPKNKENIYNNFLNKTKDYKENIIVIKQNSLIAYKYIPKDLLFDFIFIDGDHRYSVVKQDIENYLPFLSNNGIIAGHDYAVNYDPEKEYSEEELESDNHQGVSKAVHEYFNNDYALYETNKEIWYVLPNRENKE
ncbi:MAG: class I SAM-dependent methyltransferase [Paludibacter sp.]